LVFEQEVRRVSNRRSGEQELFLLKKFVSWAPDLLFEKQTPPDLLTSCSRNLLTSCKNASGLLSRPGQKARESLGF
jgi:hypothetical protein